MVTSSSSFETYFLSRLDKIPNATLITGDTPGADEKRKFSPQESNCHEMLISFVQLALEVLGGFSFILREIYKRVAVLADNSSFLSQDFSVAFSRLFESISIVAIRGNGKMHETKTTSNSNYLIMLGSLLKQKKNHFLSPNESGQATSNSNRNNLISRNKQGVCEENK